MTDPNEPSPDGHTIADHESSASTAPSGVSLALAPVVLGVFLMTLITGLGLWFLLYSVTGRPYAPLPETCMILIRVHGRFAAAMILAVPMAILRAVLLWKESSKYAIRIVEVAALVALAIGLWDPTSLLTWRELADGVLSLWPGADMLPPPFAPSYDARDILAGRYFEKASRMQLGFFHAVIAPLALIGVGAVFIHRRR
jgi:hypothetical protein